MSCTPPVAIVQSAAFAGITAGVAAADAALFAGQVTKRDLEIALRIARLGPGRADARAAVQLADGLAESPGESWARVLFVSMGLPTVEPQVEIRDRRGTLVGRVDFLFHEDRTAVEFDGLVKYGGASSRQALIDEKRREDALRSLGYQVVRLTWRDLAHLTGRWLVCCTDGASSSVNGDGNRPTTTRCTPGPGFG